MLDAIRKKFSKQAVAEIPKEVIMTQETIQADAENANTEMQAQLAAVQAQLADLTAKYEASQMALAVSESAQKNLADQATAKRLEARTKAITEAVGTSNLNGLLAATDTMDDAAFDTIVGAMAKSFENESKSAMFQEKGASAEVVAPVEVDAVKRLADAISAQLNLK